MKTQDNSVWSKLDKMLPPDRPEQSFTSIEFSERYKVGSSRARARIAEMVRAGKVLKHGRGNRVWYTVVGAAE